ncbi:single-stranded DNA-binding protein [Oceanispirochaeta crateris]|uniref:Single-stranded DNA-binding protein n=1 Tax=Oceanispirochaeta crateris TaxID=2518645 RepID=A0A5C1QM48_9SPIO|nr:single-stranded DNA-binding protein [Oceanispirochaeta crateris]QEN07634.1 single-stranded DNA-binding protein [Oceanispirochaeta crateris]
MASDINRVVLVGRLTRDAELKYTSGGMAIADISLASNRSRKQGDQWVDEANFFDISLFGRRAEALAQYLSKGTQIAVEGQLRQDRWEQDGVKRSKVTIAASDIQLLGSRNDRGQMGENSYQNNNKGAAPSRNSQSFESYSKPEKSSGGQSDRFEDDIPF